MKVLILGSGRTTLRPVYTTVREIVRIASAQKHEVLVTRRHCGVSKTAAKLCGRLGVPIHDGHTDEMIQAADAIIVLDDGLVMPGTIVSAQATGKPVQVRDFTHNPRFIAALEKKEKHAQVRRDLAGA